MLPERLCRLQKEVSDTRIILFNSPEHDNIGDHLISIAEIEFLKKHFPTIEVIEVTDKEFKHHRRTIRKFITPKDIILMTGGGFMGSLWLYNGEYNIRKVMKDYPENRVVIMPQTAYFENNWRGEREKKKTQAIYNQHRNLAICLREKISYALMRELMDDHVELVLAPDMVLSMSGIDSSWEREGALLCLRNDKERVLSASEKEDLQQILTDFGLPISSTLMHTGICVGVEGRNHEVDQKISQIAKAKLVITDTLHCMIVCAITGTPCIAFNNISGKVKNVYEWIAYLPYIVCMDKPKDIKNTICKLLKNEPQKYDNSCLETYFNDLAKIIKK